MNHLNLFGVEAKEIPCIKGSGRPTTETEGAVGCFYMDADNGDIYKCTSVADGVYIWAALGGSGGDYIFSEEDKAEIVNAVLAALPNGDEVSY